MDLIDSLPPQPTYDEDAVLVYFRFTEGKLSTERGMNAVYSLEEILREELEESGAGNFDGNEFHEDTVTFFIYGHNADCIYDVIEPIVVGIPCLPGSYVHKQYANKQKEEEILLLMD